MADEQRSNYLPPVPLRMYNTSCPAICQDILFFMNIYLLMVVIIVVMFLKVTVWFYMFLSMMNNVQFQKQIFILRQLSLFLYFVLTLRSLVLLNPPSHKENILNIPRQKLT